MPLVRTSYVVAGAGNPILSYIALNKTSFIAVVGLILFANVCGHYKLMDKGLWGFCDIGKLVIN